MSQKIHETYNFGKPVSVVSTPCVRLLEHPLNMRVQFCFFVPYYFAHMIGRDYYTGTMDLADLALHNGIEHDASLCREYLLDIHCFQKVSRLLQVTILHTAQIRASLPMT
jgi:hypothetical protein